MYSLIPALPLAAFLILAIGGRRLGERSHVVGIAAVGASLGLSIHALVDVALHGAISATVLQFLNVGAVQVEIGLHIDQLAVLILPLVTGVSLIVHVYSSRYMTGDPRYCRFFAVMALFTFAMTMLVLSSNLLVTFMCWELMGICSYLLISHWAERRSSARAATKAFLVNAVADLGLGFGIVLAFATYGTLNIQEILERASGMGGETFEFLGLSIEANLVIAICLLSGAMGKSAQFPMHVWLPFAMEAPTPVSALIHAATMVNAGPFLLVRFSPLLLLAPSAMALIAVVGAVTAIYGALVSVVQSDIKRILAYSTISQIGFMIFLCGVGAFAAAIFHLLAHGFLKGFLFLSTGRAIESAKQHAGSHGHPATAKVGGLAAGSLILACIPPVVLFSGPYERLWTAQAVPSAGAAFFAVALATVFLTAIYIFRGVVSLFGAEVGRAVTAMPRLFSGVHLPLIAIAIVAASGSAFGLWTWIGSFLPAALGPSQSGAPLFPLPIVMAAGVAVAAAGWGVAYARHSRPAAVPLAERRWAKTAYVFLLNKLYVDEIQGALVVRPLTRSCTWLRQADKRTFDAIHESLVVRPVARWSAWLWHGLDTGLIDRTPHSLALMLRAVANFLGMARPFDRTVLTLVQLLRVTFDLIAKAESSATLQPVARAAHRTGGALNRAEYRTLQQDLLVIVCWLVVAIGIMYLLAL